MPPTWDNKADRDLLLAIISLCQEGSLKSIPWGEVSERLTAMGYSFTHEACRQHFQKIRKESKGGPATANGSTPSTPAKGKKATPKPRSNGKGKSAKSAAFAGDDDEEEEFATPSKKRKLATKKEEDENVQTAELFKMEETTGDYYGDAVDLDHDDYYH